MKRYTLDLTPDQIGILKSFINETLSLNAAMSQLGWTETKVRFHAGKVCQVNVKNREYQAQRPLDGRRSISAQQKVSLKVHRKNISITLPTFSWDKDDTTRE